MSQSPPIRRTVVVTNPNGLHMRPSVEFATLANKFKSKVVVYNGNSTADGKSPMQMMLLVALPGAELILEVDGPDSCDAIQPLLDLLGSKGDFD